MMAPVWDELSTDRGETWQAAQRLPAEWGLTAVTADPAGQLHLLGVGPSELAYWLWDGGGWLSETPLLWPLTWQGESLVSMLAAAVNKNGQMVVVLTVPAASGEDEHALLYALRTLTLPPIQSPVEVATAAPSPTPIPPTPTPEPAMTETATQVAPGSGPVGPQSPLGQALSTDRTTQLAVAFSPFLLLLLFVVGRTIFRAMRVKPR
jgi:hypothetical protein